MHSRGWLPRGFAALILTAAFSGAALVGAAAADTPSLVPNAWTPGATGWEDILPGPDLKGWVRQTMSPKDKLGRAQWHVDNGTLVCDGDGGHEVLLFDRKLRNCIFHVEFCFTKIEGKKGYNSGVFARTSRDAAIWHQAQVGSVNGGYWFGVTPDGTGTRKFNIPTVPTQVKEAGQWNTFEVTAHDRTLDLLVNGVPANPFTECGEPEGYLGLEAEGYLITFRNLELKVLP